MDEHSAPDAVKKEELLQILQFDAHDLESALDPDEISRVEFSSDGIFIIWKRPNRVSYEEMLKFEVSSVGVFLQPDQMTVILGEDASPFTAGREFRDATSLTNVLLRFLLNTTRHYLEHLKAIKHLTGELERKLSHSMENRYLLQMFSLSESLIYYLSALESNAVVLGRLRANAHRIGFSEEERETMDDIIMDDIIMDTLYVIDPGGEIGSRNTSLTPALPWGEEEEPALPRILFTLLCGAVLRRQEKIT